MNSKPVSLFGNLGSDPEIRTIPGRTKTFTQYDPIIDEVVEKEFVTSDRELRTFSIAVNARTEQGEKVTRWIHCDDWEKHSILARTGDRVKVTGYFNNYRYKDKNGELKEGRKFVVQDLVFQEKKILRRVE